LYTIRQNLINAKLCSSPINNDKNVICTVPYPYREHCTKRILVMEEIHGEKLVDVLKRDGQKRMEWKNQQRTSTTTTTATKSPSSKNTTAVTDVDVNKEIMEAQSLIQPKQQQRITTEEYDRYLKLMDTSRRIQNIRTRIYNTAIGWLYNDQEKPYVSKSDLPSLNPSKLIDDLLYIHGHQVLVNGQFNADCHPGNFILCSNEESGTPYLGLIDFGTYTYNSIYMLICQNHNSFRDVIFVLLTLIIGS
jgi:hypothetical protein